MTTDAPSTAGRSRPATSVRTARRPEIEYLRAIAVLAVIFGHLGFLPGGFLGVDIFFVISGFVISQSLHDSGRATLWSDLGTFYHRRIIRILPPLGLVTAVSFAFGWMLFFDNDFLRLQKVLRYQALLLQNAYFTQSVTDYFKGIASTHVTLHTWSLAVEEQFYLCFPFVLLLLFRARQLRPWIATLAIGLLTVAAAYCAVRTTGWLERGTATALSTIIGGPLDTAAVRFYAVSFRAWEFLLGCSAFALSRHSRREPGFDWSTAACAVFYVGLLVLCGATALPLEDRSWPNGQTVGICLITAICLMAATATAGRGTGTRAGRAFAYVGNTSYSAYLWHWPLLGFFVYTNDDFGTWPLDYLVFATTLAALVVATYHGIELNRFRITPAWSGALLFAFVLGTWGLGQATRDPMGFSDIRRTIVATSQYDASECQHDDIRDIRRPFVVLFGDSHARAVRTEFTSAANSRGLDVLCFGGSAAQLTDQDATLRDFGPVLASPGYRGTFMVMRWNMYVVGFPDYEREQTGDRYLSWQGRRAATRDEARRYFALNMEKLLHALADRQGALRVGIMLQVPTMPFFPQKEVLVEYYGLRWRPLTAKSAKVHAVENAAAKAVFSELATRVPGISIIDPSPLLCNQARCEHRNGWRVLYEDDDHLSVEGEKKLLPLFEQWIEDVGKRAPQTHSMVSPGRRPHS